MKRRLLLNVIIGECTSILELLTSKDCVRWLNLVLVLDLGFDVFDGVRWLDIESDGLACECLHKNLHCSTFLVW